MSLAVFASFCGVDVSERQLDVHLLPEGASTSFAHDIAGIGRLVAWLASRERPLVVVEASRCRAPSRRSPGASAREVGSSAPWSRPWAGPASRTAVVNPRQSPRLRPRLWPPGQDRPARRADPGAVRRAHAAGATVAGQ